MEKNPYIEKANANLYGEANHTSCLTYALLAIAWELQQARKERENNEIANTEDTISMLHGGQ